MASGVGLDNFTTLKLKSLEEESRVKLALKESHEKEKKRQQVEIETAKKDREKPDYILKMAYANYAIIKNYCQGQITSDVLLVANSHIRKIENKLIPKLPKNQSKEKLQLYASSTAQTTVELGSAMGGQHFYCPLSFKNLEDYSKNLN
jgi:hypothetical protein